MKLNVRIIGEGEPIIIMHGVFGSSDNWQSVGKILSETYQVFLVDLRNHGNSPHSNTFNYQVMAEDVIELMETQNLTKATVLGHSMGGKVAMNLASISPDKITKLIVVDIAPKAYPPHHQLIFEGFNAVDLVSVRSRGEAEKQMEHVIKDFGIRQFLLKNLYRNKEGNFSWKLNLSVIQNAANSIGDSSISLTPFLQPSLFIAGSKSDYIKKEDHALILEQYPNATIATIEGAGHWVHAEKPKELISTVIEFLN